MLHRLPPREKQVVDILYARGQATAAEICEALFNPPSNSAVRAMLGRLETKGVVRRVSSPDRSYLYAPVVPEVTARHSALRQVVSTFFNGSPLGAATALLGMSKKASLEEIETLERLLAKVREEEQK